MEWKHAAMDGAHEDPDRPDVATASDDYARRFSGALGAWFLGVQERAVVALLPPTAESRILDVGGGHNQLAEPLTRRGYRVTVHGSAPECRRRVEASATTRDCAFTVGPLTALPVADRAFDVVVSVRVLAHAGDWQRVLAEICRVAAGAVIVEVPVLSPFNRVAPALFRAKQQVEKNTRHWRSFGMDEMEEALRANGFRVVAVRRQFALPMALYRALGSRAMAAVLEGCCRLVGLTAAIGSPVVMKAVRE